MGLTTRGLYFLPGCTKNLLPHQPRAKEPGSRDEPHRFDINLESTSVKWKPNSLSFLYRSVSSTQKLTVFPAREREQTALSHSLHPIKPLDGLDSCCLLIMGRTSLHEVCCINRSWNNPAIVLGKLGHFELSIFMSIIPTGCHDLEPLWWNEGNKVMRPAHSWLALRCILVVSLLLAGEGIMGGGSVSHHPCSTKTLHIFRFREFSIYREKVCSL